MKIILYYGLDPEFMTELEKATGELRNSTLYRCLPENNSLFDEVWKLRPHLVMLDATFSNKLTEEVRWLKTLTIFHSTVFTALCKDELELKKGESLLASGLSLLHLKNNEPESFIQDCFKIAFDYRKHVSVFAQAKDLQIPLSLGILSVLTSVNAQTFTIESDLTVQKSVNVSLPMLGGETEISAEVLTSNEGGVTAHFSKTYEVKFPFPGPWDELTENSLQQETVETWVHLRQANFDRRNKHLCLFTCNDKFTSELYKRSSSSWYQIFRSSDEALGQLYHSRPGVIFFDLQTEEGSALSQISEIMGAIKEIRPTPMLIIFGSRLDSFALRKLFNYDYILAVTERLEIGTFLALEKIFLNKKSSEEENYFLTSEDLDRILYLRVPVTLTSLTEKYVTFIMDSEIPFYTVAKMELPIPAYLTIIPPEGRLSSSKHRFHYQAIIHGVSEENLAHLRKIVNQLIYRPVSELSPEAVENMLKQDYLPKSQASVLLSPVIIDNNNIENQDYGDERFKLKRDLKGKSKL